MPPHDHSAGGALPPPDHDDPGAVDFGPCCICEAPHADVLLMLTARAPVPGMGWGCFQCGLSQDGALAVLCAGCEGDYATQGAVETALRFVCAGLLADGTRRPIEDLRGEHVHVRRRHPEVSQVPAFQVLPSDTRFAQSMDEGQGCLCSRCGTTIWPGVVAIRAWPDDGRYEYRYHPVCYGAEPHDDDQEDWDDDE